jgi:DNA-binding IscR family transcriptional regulator
VTRDEAATKYATVLRAIGAISTARGADAATKAAIATEIGMSAESVRQFMEVLVPAGLVVVRRPARGGVKWYELPAPDAISQE